MDLKIIKQEKNPFLQREELTIEISSESTPNASEVISELGKDAALTVVKKINTNFGRQKFLTEVVVYDTPEARKKVETIPQKIKKKMAADNKATEEAEKKKATEEAAATEAPAEEKPAEEEPKPEEPKTEETSTEKTESKPEENQSEKTE